ncbi:MAG: hypothetical protein R2825_03855 [Saprospiraceae bacterium]
MPPTPAGCFPPPPCPAEVLVDTSYLNPSNWRAMGSTTDLAQP